MQWVDRNYNLELFTSVTFTDFMLIPVQPSVLLYPPASIGAMASGDQTLSLTTQHLGVVWDDFSVDSQFCTLLCVDGPQEMGRYSQGLTYLSVAFGYSSLHDKGHKFFSLNNPHLPRWATLQQLLHVSNIDMIHYKQAASFPSPCRPLSSKTEKLSCFTC